MKYVQRFLRDAAGATAIEYALLASLIALVIIKGVSLTGSKVSTVFAEVGAALK